MTNIAYYELEERLRTHIRSMREDQLRAELCQFVNDAPVDVVKLMAERLGVMETQ